jgi:hypothetical protein
MHENMARARSSIDRIDDLHRNIWAFVLSLDGLSYVSADTSIDALPLHKCRSQELMKVVYLKAGSQTSNLLTYIPRLGISTG